MAFQFNPFTGEFDEVTVTSGVPTPLFTLDGEISAPVITVTNGLYQRLTGVIFQGFNTGSSGGFTLPNIGQPIPIGMGLTMLYSQGFRPVGVDIKQGQPIPIGMGLTMTYAQNVT